MMKSAYHPSLVFLLLFCSSFANAQESELEDGIKAPAWEYDLKFGIGASSEINSESNWLVPQTAASFETGLSKKIGENFRFSTGVGFDYYSFKSKPYYYSYTTYSFNPWSGVATSYSNQENFLRESKRQSAYVSVPLRFEYQGNGTWAPYFNIGAVFSFNVFDRLDHTNQETGETVYTQQYDGDLDPAGSFAVPTLFGSIGGGVRYRKGNTSYRFGLMSNIGLTNYERNSYNDWKLPHSLKFEIGMSRDISMKRYQKYKKLSDDTREERLNYFYVELPKFVDFEWRSMLYPVNYERAFVINDMLRINARFGVALENYKQGNGGPKGLQLAHFQAGAGWIYGKVHSLEVSMGVGRYWGPSGPDVSISPSIGYRFEPKGLFFGRVAIAPDFWMNTGLNYFYALLPSVSLGVHF